VVRRHGRKGRYERPRCARGTAARRRRTCRPSCKTGLAPSPTSGDPGQRRYTGRGEVVVRNATQQRAHGDMPSRCRPSPNDHAVATMKPFRPGVSTADKRPHRRPTQPFAKPIEPCLDPYRSAIAAPRAGDSALARGLRTTYDGRTLRAGRARSKTGLLRGEPRLRRGDHDDSLDGAPTTARYAEVLASRHEGRENRLLAVLTGGEEPARETYTSCYGEAQDGRLGRAGLGAAIVR